MKAFFGQYYLAMGVFVSGVVGFVFPELFSFFANKMPWVLGLIMLAMGLTLSVEDFLRVIKRPYEVFLGVALQFLIMPLIAVSLVSFFGLTGMQALGVILVGCAPGGTASNVLAYLAKGDVALSVSLTAVSTLFAPFLTPFILMQTAGAIVEIQFVPMMLGLMKMVLFPVLLGVAIHHALPRVTERFMPMLPSLSSIGIMIMVATVVSLSADKLLNNAPIIILVVLIHNIVGLGLGYAVMRLLHRSTPQTATVAIEVGTQNSGMSATLAMTHFTAEAAIASSFFSVFQNVVGSLFATWMKRQR